MLCALGAWDARADEPADKMPELRKYGDGPLAQADFQGKVPARRPKAGSSKAFAVGAFNLHYECSTNVRTEGNTTEVHLREIDVFSILHPEQSWAIENLDEHQLDFAQGNFDIVQAQALEAQLHFAKLIDNGEAPVGMADSREKAFDDLFARIMRVLEPYHRESEKQTARYLRVTKYGLQQRAVANLRRKHIETLEVLVAELKMLTDE